MFYLIKSTSPPHKTSKLRPHEVIISPENSNILKQRCDSGIIRSIDLTYLESLPCENGE